MSLHLTYVAVMAELFCAKAPAPSVGEHALGAMHLHGPPLRTDAHGWALNVVSAVLSRTGGAPPAEAPAGLGARSASLTKGEELKPRLSRGGGLQAEHAAALLSDNAVEPDAEAANGDTHANGSVAGGPVHVMPEHANTALRVLRIIRDRLLHNPMVLGAVAGVITTLAVKARNRKAKLPYVRARRVLRSRVASRRSRRFWTPPRCTSTTACLASRCSTSVRRPRVGAADTRQLH